MEDSGDIAPSGRRAGCCFRYEIWNHTGGPLIWRRNVGRYYLYGRIRSRQEWAPVRPYRKVSAHTPAPLGRHARPWRIKVSAPYVRKPFPFACSAWCGYSRLFLMAMGGWAAHVPGRASGRKGGATSKERGAMKRGGAVRYQMGYARRGRDIWWGRGANRLYRLDMPHPP